MTISSAYANYQWVCLQDQQQCLYAELIQVVEARGIAWLRPHILIEAAEDPFSPAPRHWVDLRQGPDLLLPVLLLRPALDTELLPLLPLLAEDQENRGKSTPPEQGRQQLNQLIYRLWQADPACFKSPHQAAS